uniref:NADH dehydrogenase subunit 3 n=1 Tax=Varestrongylus eleguneniensis TaxID=1258553 RepID=UPI00226CA47F|nr:NADH dehydrogenase subunit 3 [Varestrongylus eleguneniensis]UZM11411.1 NADH dehydrogenase subunit 3 [Varestrongylus eleguneniensis]
MIILLMVLGFSVFLVMVLYFMSFFLSLKEDGLNKVNSFESGFLSLVKVQNSFSIHFFVIMLMFVIFDLEIVMFVGLLVSDVMSLISVFFLLVFVLGGFYMEWSYGKLLWAI